MSRKLIFSVFILIFLAKFGLAQDIHFSQFYASPLSLSPAMTGHFDGDWRFMNNYRNQWSSITVPFQTISIGFDKPFFLLNQKFSAGIYIIDDNSGDAKLHVNKIFLSLAFHKKIGSNTWSFGVQGGPVIKTLSLDKLTFYNQWYHDGGEFDQNIANGEPDQGLQIMYPDINLGIMWSKKTKKFSPEMGISVFHLTMPNESFQGNSNKLPIRYIIHAGGRLEIKEKAFIRPNLLYMGHTKVTDFVAGTNFGFYMPENGLKMRSIYLGVMARNNFSKNFDAVIGIIGIEFRHIDIGFSYDVNISNLKTSTENKGGFEISLIYTAASSRVKKITLPCDRY